MFSMFLFFIAPKKKIIIWLKLKSAFPNQIISATCAVDQSMCVRMCVWYAYEHLCQ